MSPIAKLTEFFYYYIILCINYIHDSLYTCRKIAFVVTCSFSLLVAKPVVDMIKECRMNINDFEVLEVIGRGAFGEVKVSPITNRHIMLVWSKLLYYISLN